MTIKQISIFVENKPGRLAEITEIFAQANIDIRALSIADTTDYGILRIIVNDPDEALAVVKKAGVTASITDVLAIRVKDTPGGYSKGIRCLADGDMSVEYSYAFITPQGDDAYVIIRVDDNEKAAKLLMDSGVQLATQEEVSKL